MALAPARVHLIPARLRCGGYWPTTAGNAPTEPSAAEFRPRDERRFLT